jgi:NitT/TauT family transport system substrate-binding protein
MTERLLTGRRTLLGAAGAAALMPLSRPALTQTLRKVTLVYGVQTIEGASEAFFASVPLGLGFYREEGLDVEIQTVSGASAALNLLASGRAQFTTHGAAGLLAGVGRGVPMKGFICQIPDYFVSIGVAEDGPIRTLDDLKGKIIGVSAVGGAPHFVIKSVLRKLGWNPDTDVQFLGVGTALPALDALRRNRVQALVVWDTIFALYEFNGQKFRYFRPDPIPQLGFTHTTNTLQTTIDREPALPQGMARAMAKALVYMAAAQPAELTKLHFKVFPASRPTGMPEDRAIALDGLRLERRKPVMRFDQRVFSRVEQLGDCETSKIEGHRDLLAEGGEIPQALPIDRYFTRQFLPQANAIDVPALIQQARAFRA